MSWSFSAIFDYGQVHSGASTLLLAVVNAPLAKKNGIDNEYSLCNAFLLSVEIST